jgi:hypothetical protein
MLLKIAPINNLFKDVHDNAQLYISTTESRHCMFNKWFILAIHAWLEWRDDSNADYFVLFCKFFKEWTEYSRPRYLFGTELVSAFLF